MRSIDRERAKTKGRVYQYATGRGGVPIGNQSPMDDESSDRVYQYATGRGGISYSRRDMDKFRESHYGKGPKGWKRSDERIKEEVCEALYNSDEVDASQIEISVKDGVVSLKGTVDTRSTKRITEDLVDDVAGVSDVENLLTLNTEPMPKSFN